MGGDVWAENLHPRCAPHGTTILKKTTPQVQEMLVHLGPDEKENYPTSSYKTYYTLPIRIFLSHPIS